MSGYFHAATFSALTQLYQTHELALDQLVFWTAIGLQRLRPEYDARMLGYCVGGLCSVFNNEFVGKKLYGQEWLQAFWQTARKIDESLHERIENENEKFLGSPILNIELPENELKFHYILSNTGNVRTECLRDIRLESLYSVPILKIKDHDTICVNRVCTVDGNVCWAVTFDWNFIEARINQIFVEFLQDVIDKTV